MYHIQDVCESIKTYVNTYNAINESPICEKSEIMCININISLLKSANPIILIQAYLGDLVILVPDHHNKTSHSHFASGGT